MVSGIYMQNTFNMCQDESVTKRHGKMMMGIQILMKLQ